MRRRSRSSSMTVVITARLRFRPSLRRTVDVRPSNRARRKRQVLHECGRDPELVDRPRCARPAVIVHADGALPCVGAGSNPNPSAGHPPLLSQTAYVARARRQRSGRPRARLASSRPPSTSSTLPVTHEAAGDARKMAARAMSSGSPRRRRGVRLHHLGVDLLVVEHGLEGRRGGGAHGDGVHPHLGGEVGGQQPGHVGHGRLGGAVGHEPPVAQAPDGRGDVHHRARAARAGGGWRPGSARRRW